MNQKNFEGQLIYKEEYGIEILDFPSIEEQIKLNFFKGKFSTGYRKFSVIDVVIAKSQLNDIFLMTNPVFSDRYSSLTKVLEEIKEQEITPDLIQQIVELIRITGVKITAISDKEYQIWFGDDKWRLLEFKTNRTLKIEMKSNYELDRKLNWWQKLFPGFR